MRASLFAALVVVTACQLPEDPSTSTTEQDIVNGVGFSPLSGGTVGDVQVGTTSAPYAISIYPTGIYEVYYTITSITGCSDFPVNAPGLPAEIHRTCLLSEPCVAPACVPALAPPPCDEWEITEYDFSTMFHPAIAGASSCALQIQVSGLGLKTYTINGNGTVPPVAIDVQPAGPIGFGDVRRNTASSAATINARNSGGQPLQISSATASAGFTIVSGPAGGGTVAVGATQPFGVTCNPTATGPISGTFRINSNAPNTPSVVNLTCNGIDSNLDVTPSPAAVPTTRVGEPVQRTVQLVNSGTASMTIQSATLSGAGLTATGLPTANQQLGAGASITSTISFDAATAGDATGMLTVVYDGGQMRAIPVSAKALATSMSMTPDGTIDLGPVCVGQSASQDVTVVANAEGSFKVTAVSTPDAPFTVTSPSLPATAQGSGANHVTLSVGVAPAATGPLTAEVMVTTDIPGGMPRPLALTATGLTAGVSATPAELDLGPAAVNKTTIGQEIDLTNCATSAAMLANPRIEGDDAGDFAIVQQPSSLNLGANGAASFLVIAQPHSTGTKHATFSIDHPGGTATVTLSADGTGEGSDMPDPTGTDTRPSYYACSAGGASGAWPLLLALAVVLARRRRVVC